MMSNNRKIIADDLLKGFAGQEHEFSEKYKNDMKKLFERDRKVRFYSKMKAYSRLAAAIFIAAIVISAATIGSVGAWRIRFMNFIIEMTQWDTNIRFTDDNSKSTSYTFENITLAYVPEGFKLEKNERQRKYVYLKYKKDYEFFNFRTRNIVGTLSIDTEDAHVKELAINGREALYSENDNNRILVWHDDELMYILTGSISESELVKIAESIKK